MHDVFRSAARNLRSREQTIYSGAIIQSAGFLELSLSMLGGGIGGVKEKAESLDRLLAKIAVEQIIQNLLVDPTSLISASDWSSVEQNQMRAIAQFLSGNPELVGPALGELRILVSDPDSKVKYGLIQRIRNRVAHTDKNTVAKGITGDDYQQFMDAADPLISQVEAFVEKYGAANRSASAQESSFHAEWSSFSKQVAERLKSSNWHDAGDLRLLIERLLTNQLTSSQQKEYLQDAATCIDFPGPPRRRFIHVPGKGTRVETLDGDKWQSFHQDAEGAAKPDKDISDVSDPSGLPTKESKWSKAGRFAANAGKVIVGALIIAVASRFE